MILYVKLENKIITIAILIRDMKCYTKMNIFKITQIINIYNMFFLYTATIISLTESGPNPLFSF